MTIPAISPALSPGAGGSIEQRVESPKSIDIPLWINSLDSILTQCLTSDYERCIENYIVQL